MPVDGMKLNPLEISLVASSPVDSFPIAHTW